MTKLDEIEAAFDEAEEYTSRTALWADTYGELLVRAVRQFGAIVRERESEIITADRVEAGSLDPDVLDLIAPD